MNTTSLQLAKVSGLAIALLLLPEMAAQRTLHVRNKIITQEPKVKLQDFIFNTHVLDENEKELVIMDAPPADNSTSITLVQLAYMLQGHENLLDAELQGGRSSIDIERIPVKEKKEKKKTEKAPRDDIDPKHIEKARKDIHEYLKCHPPWMDWKIDVLINSDDMRKISEVGEFNHLSVINKDTNNMLGAVKLRVLFLNHDHSKDREIDIQPMILREVNVAVVTESLMPGAEIENHRIKMAPVWMGEEKDHYIMDPLNCVGKVLARKVSAGDILRPGDLADKICAKRGDLIHVDCKYGAMTVSTMARAMETGRKGENVRVKNLTSSKIFTVELIDEKYGLIDMDKM